MNSRQLQRAIAPNLSRHNLICLVLVILVCCSWPCYSDSDDGSARATGDVQPAVGYSLDGTGDPTRAITDPRLIGFWECRGEQGTITLEFQSDKQLVFAGRQVSYELLPGTIRVHEEAGFVDYDYDLRGKTLCLTLKEGERAGIELQFTRVDLSPQRSNRDPSAQ